MTTRKEELVRRRVLLSLAVGAIVLVQAIGSLPALAAAGDLDFSFSHDGLVLRKQIPGTVYSTIVQPDGKIVAAGVADPPARPFSMMVERFLPNGTLDPTFGG